MKRIPYEEKKMMNYIAEELYKTSDQFYDFILDVQGNNLRCTEILGKTKHLKDILNTVEIYANYGAKKKKEKV